MNSGPDWAACMIAYYESFGASMSYGRGRSVLFPAALHNSDYVGTRYGD